MPHAMNRVLWAVLAVAACNKGETTVGDGGPDLVSRDSTQAPGDAPIPLAVDFAVENCPAFDPVEITCTGTVPLAVRFVPLATTTVTKYLWDFGDGSSGLEVAPYHVYANPGEFTVRIVATGAGGGVVTKAHIGFIVAKTNALGQPCDASQQCDDGLFCLCPSTAPCSSGPSRGVCASACPSGLCDSGQICAGLLTATPPEAADPWQTDLCLLGCTTDLDCAAGLHCRTLPPGPVGIAWVHGCFADVPADVGEPCMDAAGSLRNDLCASGMCADLGSQGTCSSNCANASCPLGSDCAVLGDGRSLCLRPCSGNFTCAKDALLACQQPGPGVLGYHLADPGADNSASTYCAPKSCGSDVDCLPSGICQAQPAPGHCVRR